MNVPADLPAHSRRTTPELETTPDVKPPAIRNKLFIIIGVAIVVLLAIIASAVSSEAIRAGREADAKASAIAEESKMALKMPTTSGNSGRKGDVDGVERVIGK